MENPNYYAVIPANVRYDKELKPTAKLLYGEIAALTQKDGKCWATNNYFAELYGMAKETISRLIADLARKGYITTEIIYKEGTKEVVNRYIRICGEGMEEKVKPSIDEKVKENNTSINNTSLNNIIPPLTSQRGMGASEEQKETKHKYGEYKNVLLTDTELQKIKSDFTNWEDLIKFLDEYIEMKGYKAKSHYLCLRRWVANAVKEQEHRKKQQVLGGGETQEDPWEAARKQLEKDGVLDDV